jgi:hypothetical protein
MSSPTFDSPPTARPRDSASTPVASRPRLPVSIAARVGTSALLLAALADALFHDEQPGLAFPIWIALVTASLISLVWTADRTVTREAGAWLAAAFVFSCGFAWRGSELQPFDFLATAGALAMAAVALSDRPALFARRLRDTVWAVAAIGFRIAGGPIPLSRDLAASERRTRWGSLARTTTRTVLLVAIVLVVFGSLLTSADPIFANLVAIPDVDLSVVLSHVALIAFFGWMLSGWARSALVVDPEPSRAPGGMPFSLGMLDVTATLVALNVLFAVFVATQLGWFFGGERFLHARTGLTAAGYARQGFFQMVWVVALVVPLLVATRAALRPDRALARRHTMLSLPIIGLLGAIIVSATLRMRLYVHYFGMTTERFYPLMFMAWLAVVLVWLALTVLRGWGRPFVAGTVVSALATLAALNIADPDLIVARINLHRAANIVDATETPLDLEHLARLSGRAVALATQATLASPSGREGSTARGIDDAQRCKAANTLLTRWGPASPARVRQTLDASWRFWNYDEVRAVRAVAAHSAELRAVQHAACERAQQRVPHR